MTLDSWYSLFVVLKTITSLKRQNYTNVSNQSNTLNFSLNICISQIWKVVDLWLTEPWAAVRVDMHCVEDLAGQYWPRGHVSRKTWTAGWPFSRKELLVTLCPHQILVVILASFSFSKQPFQFIPFSPTGPSADPMPGPLEGKQERGKLPILQPQSDRKIPSGGGFCFVLDFKADLALDIHRNVEGIYSKSPYLLQVKTPKKPTCYALNTLIQSHTKTQFEWHFILPCQPSDGGHKMTQRTFLSLFPPI